MSSVHSFQFSGNRSEPFVFVCHAQDDHALVLPQVEWLQSAGLPVWFDEGKRTDARFLDDLASAINAASGFILFGSRHVLDSPDCLNQIHYALGMQKPVFAVYERKIELPPGLVLGFGSTQALFRNTQSEAAYRDKLVEGARLLVSGGRAGWSDHEQQTSRPNLTTWIRQFLKRHKQHVVRSEVADHALTTQDNVPANAQTDLQTDLQTDSQANQQTKPRISVLPFQALASDDRVSDIARGITSDLTSYLSGNPHLDVVRCRVAHDDLTNGLSEAQNQRVQYAIEGVVRSQGSRLQVNLSLTDVDTRSAVWGRTFLEELEHALDLQGQFMRAMARFLGPAVWRSEGIRVTRQQPANLAAWELVHRATFIEFAAYRRETAMEAESLVRLALESDPDYALGLSTLGRILINKVQEMVSDDQDAEEKEATRLVEKAILLSPSDPQVLINTAVVKVCTGRLEESVSLAQRALNMDPLIKGGLGLLGVAMIFTGKAEDGIRTIEEEIARDPDSPEVYLSLTNLSSGYEVLGDYKKAESLLKKAMHMHPNFHKSWFNLALIQTRFDMEVAAKSFARARQLEPGLTLEKYKLHFRRLIRDPSARALRIEQIEQLWRRSAEHLSGPGED